MRVAPDKPGHTMTEEQRLEMLNNPSCSSIPSPSASDTNNSHSHSQDEPNQRHQAGCNNVRGPDGAEGGVYGGDILEEEMEEQLRYGTSSSPFYGKQEPQRMGAESGAVQVEEDMVMAPLASPETLSVASGLSAIGAFSPSSSLMGRDLLRHSLQRCAQKQLDSPSEAEVENCEEGRKRLLDLARGPSLGAAKGPIPPPKKAGLNTDLEAGDGEDYTVKLRSGNTICVKADVVNEMTRRGKGVDAVPASVQFEDESTDPLDEDSIEAQERKHLLAKDTAVLEPSSHIHVATHSTPSRCVEGNSYSDTNITKPVPPTDINLKPSSAQWSSGENGKSPSPLTDYVRHSPLEQSNQHEYGHPNTYYTHAGVGYPNNAFHTPQRFLSFPSDDANHLLEDLCQEGLPNTEEGSSFVAPDIVAPLINHTDTFAEGNQREEPANGHALSSDPLIPSQGDSVLAGVHSTSTPLSSAHKQLKGKKVFKKAESDNCLIGGGKLSPRMRRSAEQDDIAHLCDALEVFESEEDKARLCQSVTTLLEEDKDISSSNKDNMEGNESAVPKSEAIAAPVEAHTTPSALVPASGKRKTSSNQSVSFGGSVIIPASQSPARYSPLNPSELNGLPGAEAESDFEAASDDTVKLPTVDFCMGGSAIEKQEPQASDAQPLSDCEASTVPNKLPVEQVTAPSLVDIFTDNGSSMLQETHL